MKNLLRKILAGVLITTALVAVSTIKPADDRVRTVSADDTNTTPTDGAGSVTTSPTPSATATPTQAAGAMPDGISQIQLQFRNEEVIVVSNAQVYYAQLKKATDVTAKPADMIPAAKSSDTTYLIDISCYSPAKDLYLGITNKLTEDSNGLYPVMNCKIPSTYKKVVFNVNFAAEGDAASGNGILKNVIISNKDGTTVTYDHTATPTEQSRPISELNIEWRKGNNCSYSNINTLTPSVWESMKTSGAILYLRLGAVDSLLNGEGRRYSQESKIKLAIVKSKPLKVDVTKLSVPITNGMQVRLKGNSSWVTILPYNGKSTLTKALRDPSKVTGAFDPYNESTSEKVKDISISDLFTMVGYDIASNPPTSVGFEVRVAATTKKPASRISSFKVPYQYPAPVVEAKKSGADVMIASVTNSPDDKVSGKYEYTIVDKADLDANNFIVSQVSKWYTVKSGTVLKSGAGIKGTYTRKDGSRKTVILGDTGSVVLVRRSGIKESKKNAAVLASAYAVINPTTLPNPQEATPTEGASPEPTGGGTTPEGGSTTPEGGSTTPEGGSTTP
nr:hypothetical protein [Lachnospiraceae bacterium]